jgi:TolB-like protein/Tfp pilus assembly protein PilF
MVMDVLVLLASASGDVVTTDQIVDAVWKGRPTAPEAIVQKVKVLRDKLGDNPRNPEYIQTHPKIGYRIVCPIDVPEQETAERAPAATAIPAYLLPALGGALAIAVIAIVVLNNRPDGIDDLSAVDSIAVCPFENMSSEADQYFVDGFREQLVSTLYSLPGIRVVKTSCSDDAFPAEPVDSLVTGSVLQAGGRVRITAQLMTRRGVVLWSQSVDGAAEEVEEVFALHERVANHVRDALLGESEILVTASSRPTSLRAYDLYLLGSSAFSRRSERELIRAVDLFQRAIALDPNYGPAYLGLANSYVLLADYPSADVMSMYEKAIETASTGVEMDAGIRDLAGTVYGFVDTKRFNWTAAAKAFETAINSGTVYPTSHHWYSRFLANVGLLEKSLEHAKIAQEMDTASPILNARLGVAYHWLNDSANADTYYARAADQEVGSWIHNLSYTLFLIREGRMDEARRKAKEALQSYGQSTAWVDPVFDGMKQSPRAANSEDMYTAISAAASDGSLPTNIELTLWALLGQSDRAMEAAWSLTESGNYFEVEILYLDEFRVLREHGDFQELLEALGLTDYWAGIGCHWDGEQVLCGEEPGA